MASQEEDSKLRKEMTESVADDDSEAEQVAAGPVAASQPVAAVFREERKAHNY